MFKNRKNFLLFNLLVILSVDFSIAPEAKAESISTSVVVREAPKSSGVLGISSESESGIGGMAVDGGKKSDELDIKTLTIDSELENSNINAHLLLNNLTDESKLIDRLELIVSKLDGTVQFTKSIKTYEPLQPNKDTTLNYNFPGNLSSGQYIGVVQIYSDQNLLGQSKTTLSVAPMRPEVLGASAMTYDSIPLFIIAVFTGLTILGILMIVRRQNFLQKGISIKLIDIIAIATCVSTFGLGVFGGYMLAKVIFP